MNPDRRRCRATNRSGRQCGRAPIRGGLVCDLHGGKAPQTLAAAQAALLKGRDLAIDFVVDAVTTHPPCPTCGRSDAHRDPVALRAAQIILDRTGFHPTLALQNTDAPVPDFFRWLPAERVAQMQAWMAEAERAMRRGDAQPKAVAALPEAVDAELIPEEDNGYDPLG